MSHASHLGNSVRQVQMMDFGWVFTKATTFTDWCYACTCSEPRPMSMRRARTRILGNPLVTLVGETGLPFFISRDCLCFYVLHGECSAA